jgi:hypothetical protein
VNAPPRRHFAHFSPARLFAKILLLYSTAARRRSMRRAVGRPSLEATAERRALSCFRLRALVGQLRQAFFELFRGRLQTVGLAFGGIL